MATITVATSPAACGPPHRAAGAGRVFEHAEIDVERRARKDPGKGRRDEMRERDGRNAEQVVLKIERYQRAEPQQPDDLPALLGDRLVDRR